MISDCILNQLENSAQIYAGKLSFCRGKTYYNNSDTAYCVNITPKAVTIVFRGTDSKDEWRSNFRVCKKKIPYNNVNSPVRVHCGFIDTYKRADVRDKIHSLIPKDVCRVIVTGHSRGAALALLCALDVQYNFPDKSVEAYLFGCPRVGNAAFKKSYNHRVFKTLRIDNGNDIVTKLPPAILGYRHVGTRISIGMPRLPFVYIRNQHLPSEYYKNAIYKFFA